MLLRSFTNLPLKTLLLIVLLCPGLAAQTDQKSKNQKPAGNRQDDLLRIETELVQIDVVVADKQGKLVRDLKREDFELFEDGKKQPLTHFAVGTATQPAKWLTTERRKAGEGSTSKPVTNEVRAGRYVVLAVDDYHLSPPNLINVKRSLKKFINQQMVAGDQVAVVTTSGNVGLFQQFTSEREVLERAVNRLTLQERSVVDSSSIPRITEHQAELIEFGDRDALELAINDIIRREGLPPSQPGQSGQGRPGGGRGGQGGQSGQAGSGGQGVDPQREMLEGRARSQARMVLAMSANYTRTTLDTLEAVIRSLRALPGRKMLVLLSDGFFLGGNSVHSQVYDVRRITDAATRAGVVIYSIDARGLVALTPGGDASESATIDLTLPGVQSRIEQSALQAKRDGMNALAVDTGGALYSDSNDLNLGLQRVLDDNETYYVLAYEPPESRRDGRFHKIEVRLAGRPDLKIRTRKGYFSPSESADKTNPAKERPAEKEKSPEKAAQLLKVEKEKQLLVGLGSLFPLRQIPIEMAADFMNVPQGSYALLNTHIETANLTFEQAGGRQQTVIDLSAVVFDEKGKVAGSFSDRLGISLKQEDMQQMVKHGFNYRKVAMLKPGFYQVRIAVREDKTGNLGSAAGWIEIPDINSKQLMVSGVLLSTGDDSSKDLKDAAAGANAEGYKPQPSSATRRFKSGGNMDFLVFAYNAKVEKNTADLVIQSQVFAGSKLVYASPLAKMAVPPEADLQRIPYAARVSLKGYDPGEYELRLMVIDRATKATAYRRVNFTVE